MPIEAEKARCGDTGTIDANTPVLRDSSLVPVPPHLVIEVILSFFPPPVDLVFYSVDPKEETNDMR